VYQTTFPNFKYKPLSFVYVEIKTSSRILTTTFVVQLVASIKPISPLRGGTCLEIVPLHVQIFTIHVQVTIVTTKLMKGGEKFVKE
jgi:hypothetical protein